MLGLPDGTRGCLFDLDGVPTQTAKAHNAAWKKMFGSYLRDRSRLTGEPFVPFDPVKNYDEYGDALAGVAAGRGGNFRFVVGVDRAGQADALRENGADIVVTDLAQPLEHS